MFNDAINATHNGTGGSGTLTLAAVTGWPQPTSWMGTSGTRIVYYEIVEYTDSTLSVLSLYERGVGSLVLSTNVLTRTAIRCTWNGTTYNDANPTALTFGNTAANVRVLLTSSAVTQAPALPGINAATGDTYALFNTRQQLDSNGATLNLTTGTKYYIPCEHRFGKPLTTFAVNATSIATTGSVRVGIYDMGSDGLPANLISEITSGSQFGINTATGLKSVTPATPLFLPPGFYFAMFQADAAVQLQTIRHYGQGGAGSSLASRDCVYLTKTGTYGALPTVADTGLTMVTLSSGNQLGLYIK